MSSRFLIIRSLLIGIAHTFNNPLALKLKLSKLLVLILLFYSLVKYNQNGTRGRLIRPIRSLVYVVSIFIGIIPHCIFQDGVYLYF